ncbi:endonuclease/exonuclease/phosphatase family protein [Bifidobacterium callitrichos]|uniref:Endonuclease/exonuclease/phosphatase family protein n=1 Tax=Bifidobacterium callitrichos TaxID=762209 RepID=A0A5M9Z9V8_9BIFI|nr:endonuclease/exonuclease/phosphatase family protein [Bifidobacterium callitrichos]KAA8815246.1 endonuclease/exonuclease/phosphatase family protein [Bifidobacterium callitrichos]
MVTVLYVVMLIGAIWVAIANLPAGLEAWMPLPYMIALIPFLWVPLGAAALVAAVAHEWGVMCMLIAVALASTTRRSEYWSKSLNPRGGKGGPTAAGTSRETTRETHAGGSDDRETSRETLPARLGLMTLNCRYGRADAERIVAEVRDRHIDVLALQEVNDDLVARLETAGIQSLLPYRQSGEPKESSDNGGYNMLFSALEPAAAVANVVAIPAADVPAITLRLAGDRTATIASAHPKSPMRGCRDWSAGIRGLGALAEAKHIGDRNIAVVMGDLNSSTDHPSFRALLGGRGRTGGRFRDASLTQGTGPCLTFPSWLPWPRIELDHILATPGVTFSNVAPVHVRNTDHLALTGTITLA